MQGGCCGASGGWAWPFCIAVPPSAAPKARLSATFGFNPCINTGCGKPAVRPLVDTGAMVFVVFGIIGINRTRQVDNHVIGDPVRAPTLDSCQRAPPQQADEQLPVQGPPAQLPTPTLSSLTAHPAQTEPPRTPGASFLLRMEQGRAFRITQESGTKPAALHH